VAVVVWGTLTAAGFVLVTAMVIALARSSTARWEREKRSPVAPVPDAVPPRRPLAVPAAWIPGAVARRIAGATGGSTSRVPPRAVARRILSRMHQMGRALGRLPSSLPAAVGRWRPSPGRSATPSLSEGTPDPAVPPAPRRSRGPRALRGHHLHGGAGRRLLARTSRLPHPHLRERFHRHDRRSEGPQALHADSDDS
jgi:hypothetical protein